MMFPVLLTFKLMCLCMGVYVDFRIAYMYIVRVLYSHKVMSNFVLYFYQNESNYIAMLVCFLDDCQVL